jgi:uncharacterized protein (DUF934 family)
MEIIRNGELATDRWAIAGDDDVSLSGDVLVSARRWPSLDATAHRGLLGLVLPADTLLEELAFDYTAVPLIAIAFDDCTDGRGYSLARLLRREGYAGDLRAVGDVRRDQVFYLERCGFTSFGIPAGRDAQELLRSLDDFSVVYQAAADQREPISMLRSRRA